jgi:hypothetical protein
MRWWLMLVGCPLLGHDVITTRITWAREISRIVHHRCANCHRPGGASPMSLLTYGDARPWARAIAEEVLERRMPPWNPVKGFGEFKHEAGLNQEEIGLIADWVEGGAPFGEERYLPPGPVASKAPAPVTGRRVALTDQMVLKQPLLARGIAVRMREGSATTIWAELPDGATEPLLEIAHFRSSKNQPYEFARPLTLPAGTKVHVEGGAIAALISSGASPGRRTSPSAPRPPAAPEAKRGGRPGVERSR